MENLFAARALMGLSLSFHIIYATIGIGLPLMLAEGIALRTGDELYHRMARRWIRPAKQVDYAIRIPKLLSLLAFRDPVLASPFGMIALESGWLVTEFGRQPWIVHGVMRVEAGVTPNAGMGVVFLTFCVERACRLTSPRRLV